MPQERNLAARGIRRRRNECTVSRLITGRRLIASASFSTDTIEVALLHNEISRNYKSLRIAVSPYLGGLLIGTFKEISHRIFIKNHC